MIIQALANYLTNNGINHSIDIQGTMIIIDGARVGCGGLITHHYIYIKKSEVTLTTYYPKYTASAPRITTWHPANPKLLQELTQTIHNHETTPNNPSNTPTPTE